MVEAGVPFVNVYDFRQQGQNWDAHFKNFNQHKTHLLPLADQTLSALLEDLETRGLLDSTIVLWMGEFGRSPRINKLAGRDHWPQCYPVLMAGGGIKRGYIHGASDKIGAYPDQGLCRPEDISATFYELLGIDPETEIRDKLGRPFPISKGRAIREVMI